MARWFIWIWLVACMGSLACGDIDRGPRQPNERPVAVLVTPSDVEVGMEVEVFFVPTKNDKAVPVFRPVREAKG